MRSVAAYGVSQLWRHGRSWVYPLYFIGVFIAGVGIMVIVNPWVGWSLLMMWEGAGALAIIWRDLARLAAWRRGYRVLYVMASPSAWIAHRLHALGYRGSVAPRIWEMHVDEQRRWIQPEENVHDAVRRFRTAYTADRLRWLEERPDDVGLLICTFNRLPMTELAALKAAGGWVYPGPLTPHIPPVMSPQRQRRTQTRMFGAAVSTKDRTDPNTWITVYVPPRRDCSLGRSISRPSTHEA